MEQVIDNLKSNPLSPANSSIPLEFKYRLNYHWITNVNHPNFWEFHPAIMESGRADCIIFEKELYSYLEFK